MKSNAAVVVFALLYLSGPTTSASARWRDESPIPPTVVKGLPKRIRKAVGSRVDLGVTLNVNETYMFQSVYYEIDILQLPRLPTTIFVCVFTTYPTYSCAMPDSAPLTYYGRLLPHYTGTVRPDGTMDLWMQMNDLVEADTTRLGVYQHSYGSEHPLLTATELTVSQCPSCNSTYIREIFAAPFVRDDIFDADRRQWPTRRLGATANFTCSNISDYTVAPVLAVCVDDGDWDHACPSCAPVTPAPLAPDQRIKKTVASIAFGVSGAIVAFAALVLLMGTKKNKRPVPGGAGGAKRTAPPLPPKRITRACV